MKFLFRHCFFAYFCIIVSAFDPDQTLIRSEFGLQGITAGKRTKTHSIQLRFQDGSNYFGSADSFRVKGSGPEEAQIDLQFQGDGIYTVFFRATKAGTYKMHLIINGNDVSVAVPDVFVVPDKNSPYSGILSPETGFTDNVFRVGVTYTTVVMCSDQFGNIIDEDIPELELEFQIIGEIDSPESCSHDSNGQYVCVWELNRVSFYQFKVFFSRGGIAAGMAEFSFECYSGVLSPQNSIVYGSAVEHTKKKKYLSFVK